MKRDVSRKKTVGSRAVKKKKKSLLSRARRAVSLGVATSIPFALAGDRALPVHKYPVMLSSPPGHVLRLSEAEMKSLRRKGVVRPSRQEVEKLRKELAKAASKDPKARPEWKYILKFVYYGDFLDAQWAYSKYSGRFNSTISDLEKAALMPNLSRADREKLNETLARLRRLRESGEFHRAMNSWLVDSGTAAALPSVKGPRFPELPFWSLLERCDVLIVKAFYPVK